MTTTELIKILQDNEKGGISHKSRQISLTVNGRYLPEPQITLSSTGDGIAGAEIDFDVDGEWLEHEADGTDEVLNKIRAEIKEWYFQTDKQELAKDPCVVDAMIDLFIRTIDKYRTESEDEE